jgi:hypothetical protein
MHAADAAKPLRAGVERASGGGNANTDGDGAELQSKFLVAMCGHFRRGLKFSQSIAQSGAHSLWPGRPVAGGHFPGPARCLCPFLGLASGGWGG